MRRRASKGFMLTGSEELGASSPGMANSMPPNNCPWFALIRSTRFAERTGIRRPPIYGRSWVRSLRDDPSPTPPASLDLCHRAVRDGVHRILYLSDTALRAVARHECGRGRRACRRALVARGVSVHPHRRLDGPVRHAPGDVVLCLDGNGLGAVFPAGAVVLAIVDVANHQWRRPVLCLVWFPDLDRPARRG